MNDSTLLNISRISQEGGSLDARGEILGQIQLETEAIALQDKAVWKASIIGVGGESEDDYWLSGEIAGNAILECSRCLSEAITPIKATFQNMLRYKNGLHELEVIDDGDEEIILFGQQELDLLPFLTESFALAIPYTTLCKDDCKGLCPNCGANRNENPNCCDAANKSNTKLGGLLDSLDLS